ncbi:flagellar biosynthesis anti-sigma factor FlgM [Ferrimonas sediminicola]|uniref:Negative regulator of flagellin synthesis n=1 Tax=Ferrimonas sediminicola TaxID=2569538 RepID=A0A4U1BB47_9GAMM|nr:flagellar biosynthesis anti-sigma factor FlgM [Ferrimonas sediminicola]TKB47789.1 flagellar biosynthesis anti-sigma factor FlgM [Ferrimonas sediminicola]
MEITPLSPQLVSLQNQEANSSNAPVSKHRDDNQSQSVSQEWQQLNQASKELDEMDSIDRNRIAALQAELSTEGYPIDLERIAEAMLEEHGSQL